MPAANKMVNLTPGTGRHIHGFAVLDLSGESKLIQRIGELLRADGIHVCRTLEDNRYKVMTRINGSLRYLRVMLTSTPEESDIEDAAQAIAEFVFRERREAVEEENKRREAAEEAFEKG